MRIRMDAGRAGMFYICDECGQYLEQKDGMLIHPLETGTFRRKPSSCKWAGTEWKRPTIQAERA